MEGQGPRRTLWEKLGRGVALGWEKARETSARVGEFAAVRLDLRSAREELESRYRLLGLLAADRFLDRGEPALERSEAQVAGLLEEIRAARAALAALEERLAQPDRPPAGPGAPAPPADPAPGEGRAPGAPASPPP